jgi:hypothetical protein
MTRRTVLVTGPSAAFGPGAHRESEEGAAGFLFCHAVPYTQQ